MKKHVTCFVENAGIKPRTLGNKAERYNNCATCPIKCSFKQFADEVSGPRHAEDIYKAYELIAKTIKMCGNIKKNMKTYEIFENIQP
jgi:hypothetical protein